MTVAPIPQSTEAPEVPRAGGGLPVFAKITSGPKFRPEASFGLKNSGTDAENHEESENTTENDPKLL